MSGRLLCGFAELCQSSQEGARMLLVHSGTCLIERTKQHLLPCLDVNKEDKKDQKKPQDRLRS